MAETTVKVGGDSREAVRELRQVGRAAADVGVSLKSMAGQAALTGLAVGTCKAHLHRARQLLRELLGNPLEVSR